MARVQEQKDVALVVTMKTPSTVASSTSTFGTSSTPTFGSMGFGQISFGGQLGGSRRGRGKKDFNDKGVGIIMVFIVSIATRMDTR